MTFDESKHPRDEEGKFTDKAKTEKTHLSKDNDDGKISFARKFGKTMKAVLVAPLMFTPADYTNYKENQILKGKKSLEQKIEEHVKK